MPSRSRLRCVGLANGSFVGDSLKGFEKQFQKKKGIEEIDEDNMDEFVSVPLR